MSDLLLSMHRCTVCFDLMMTNTGQTDEGSLLTCFSMYICPTRNMIVVDSVRLLTGVLQEFVSGTAQHQAVEARGANFTFIKRAESTNRPI